MEVSNLKQKTAKGLLWGGIGNAALQILGVVLGIFLARILSPNDYGLIGMLAIFTGIAATIINCGFSTALTNIKEATQKDYDAVFWFTVFIGLFLYISLFFCAPAIARFYGQPELVAISRILFISFLLGGIGTVSYTVMFKQLMVKRITIINVSSVFISGTTGILLAINGFTYWALVIQNVLFVSLTSLLYCVFSPWRPTFHINFNPLKKLFSFSIKLFITNIFVQINQNFLSVLLGKLYNATQLGYYTQGQKWMNMGNMFVAGMINSIAQPVLVQVNEDKKRQLIVFRKMIRFGAFVSFPLMLGLAFVGEEFIVITIGEKWLPSVPFLQLFCIWGAFVYLWTLFSNLFFTHGKSNLFMYLMIATGLLQLIVVLSLHSWGILQMVTAYLSINFISLLIGQYYIHRLIGLRLRSLLKDILPYLAITVACLFIAWIVTKNIENIYWLFVAKVIISGFLYTFVMKISRSVIFKESMDYLMTILWKKKQ